MVVCSVIVWCTVAAQPTQQLVRSFGRAAFKFPYRFYLLSVVSALLSQLCTSEVDSSNNVDLRVSTRMVPLPSSYICLQEACYYCLR